MKSLHHVIINDAIVHAINCDFLISPFSEGFIEPTTESWDAVTHLYTFSPENFYYSVLHEWAASHGKHSSGPGSICEALTFVDGRLPPRQHVDPSHIEELEALIDENTGREVGV